MYVQKNGGQKDCRIFEDRNEAHLYHLFEICSNENAQF
jgi:hypothetical protein